MYKRFSSIRLVTLFTLAVTVALATPARADDANDAKVHYQKATAHYAVGEYKEAAAEYEAAYKAKQDPALLYNAAQSHRLASDNQKALLLYKNIVKLYPTSHYAAESKDRIEKLEAAIATTQSPPNQPAPVTLGAPPAAAPPPAPTPVQPIAPAAPAAAPVPAAPPPATSAPSATVTTTAPPPSTSNDAFYTKWWFWTAAGVVVVGAAVGIALAASSTTPWANVSNVMGSVR
jgi:tetratricopeptide (TPR) repeat protein